MALTRACVAEFCKNFVTGITLFLTYRKSLTVQDHSMYAVVV